MTYPITPSQTIGPFSHEAWAWAVDATASAATGASFVTIQGTLFDGDGAPINDGMIEAWTPSAPSVEGGNTLPGFRRLPSGEDGGFTLKLSRDAAPGSEPAALVTVFARGLLVHQFTAVFLEDEDIDGSTLLAQVPSERRSTLIARKTGPGTYAWNIRMQGPQETVFFDYGGQA